MKRGFTLIELMVVITVMGIILAFAIPNFNSRGKKFDSNYKNIRDKLVLSRQTAITKNQTVTVDLGNTYVKSGNDSLALYNGITLTATSGGSGLSSIDFDPSGAINNAATLEITGMGKTDTIFVTISGYVLSR
ncbi:MAG: prepilin-type N-terminal cleavage/methylation domain-containing protein [candidate division WOR-3 bacterium]|nr:prepilin-type N-terminal cleavage/methylation domain-containing protein [candidate division WOR-3 bacterium]